MGRVTNKCAVINSESIKEALSCLEQYHASRSTIFGLHPSGALSTRQAVFSGLRYLPIRAGVLQWECLTPDLLLVDRYTFTKHWLFRKGK